MSINMKALSAVPKTALVATIALSAGVLQGEVKTDVNLVPAIRAAGKYPTYWSTATTGARTDIIA